MIHEIARYIKYNFCTHQYIRYNLVTQYTKYNITVHDIGYRNRLGRVFNYSCLPILFPALKFYQEN